jgi:pyruvate kinase
MQKKILTILGARPQFIKASVVSHAIRSSGKLNEVVLHTGQHFDENMSAIFFSELGMATPAFELGIHGGGHGEMTGRILMEIERVLNLEQPDAVLVYGDTNSTLAGALAAVKLHIPVAHVEAGLRSFNMAMPEEINRILTDRIARWLFTPTHIFGIENGFDLIAASFTRSAEDIAEMRQILEDNGGSAIKIIAKIENAEGVTNADEILRVADGLMVARGDLGVEVKLEEIPRIQKELIKKAYNAGKLCITATQMLDSMIKNPRPTRAEVTDVANAIYDGSSAIMLSGETASGLYPVAAVRTMSRIAKCTEENIDYRKRLRERRLDNSSNVTNAISHATCNTANEIGAAAIISVTKSGRTARFVSKFRPACMIIGCTPDEQVCRQLNLSWGVKPLLTKNMTTTDELFEHAVNISTEKKLLKNGDVVVITAGVPLGVSGTTNLLKVHIVGDILVSGVGIMHKSTCGNLCVCRSEEEAFEKFAEGDILVIHRTSDRLMPLLAKASGIIAESPGPASHAATVGVKLGIPVIVGAANATKILRSGTAVTLDATRGIVFYT